MELFKTFAAPDSDPGEWFFWDPKDGAEHPDTALAFRVRRIPPTVARELSRKHRLPNRKITVRRGGTEYETYTDEKFKELEAGLACNRELAAVALTDAKHAEITIGDPAQASVYSAALQAEVKAGDTISLDGRLSSEVKALVIAELPALMWWVLKKADTLGLQEAEEEEGKG